MKVIRNDHIDCFDIDDTLLLWDKEVRLGHISFGTVDVAVHRNHINEIKRSKAVGRFVVVWSKGGYEWAETVVRKLGLEYYVDLVQSKPSRYFDDLDANAWMYRVFREDK